MPGVNENKLPEKRRVEFGKYAGKFYGALPDSYLFWLAHNAFKRHDGKPRQARRVVWAREEIERRKTLINTKLSKA